MAQGSVVRRIVAIDKVSGQTRSLRRGQGGEGEHLWNENLQSIPAGNILRLGDRISELRRSSYLGKEKYMISYIRKYGNKSLVHIKLNTETNNRIL